MGVCCKRVSSFITDATDAITRNKGVCLEPPSVPKRNNKMPTQENPRACAVVVLFLVGVVFFCVPNTFTPSHPTFMAFCGVLLKMRRHLLALVVAAAVLALQWHRLPSQLSVVRDLSSRPAHDSPISLPKQPSPQPISFSIFTSPPLPSVHTRIQPPPSPSPSPPPSPSPYPITNHSIRQARDRIHFQLQERIADDNTMDFAGAPNLKERNRLLQGCHGPSKCGFMAASGYDAIASEAAKLSKRCTLVVATAIFGRKDKLQQPDGTAAEERECFFAIVDSESATFFAETASPSLRRQAIADPSLLSRRRVGVWRLLVLQLSRSPYPGEPRRASRVPKLLPFRLFPRAHHFLWIDGKLKLLVPPMELIHRYLIAPRAALALPRNLRRDHIDEEMKWIRGTLSAEPHKLLRADARKVEAQWRFYVDEQRNESLGRGAVGASTGDGDAEEWMRRTACAEGAMIVADLRSELAKCVLCAWFNEWHRFGERDQLAFSYVLHAMSRTPPLLVENDAEGDQQAPRPDSVPASRGRAAGKTRKRTPLAHRGVFLWPRNEHWNYKPRADEAKPIRYVRYVGHGGCSDRAQLDRTGRRTRPNKGCN